MEISVNYQAHYERLIASARNQTYIRFQTNRHHIVPSCLGGGDNSSNLVHLTHRQHYVAHLLLHKLYPSNIDLARAITIAGKKGGVKVNSRIYSNLMILVRSDEVARQRGKDTIAHARKCFSENPVARAKHKEFMIKLGKRVGVTIGTSNIKNYWVNNKQALSENGTKGAIKLNQLINQSKELQAKRREACVKGHEVIRKLWQIPEYAEARKCKDKETCARIVKELRNATS